MLAATEKVPARSCMSFRGPGPVWMDTHGALLSPCLADSLPCGSAKQNRNGGTEQVRPSCVQGMRSVPTGCRVMLCPAPLGLQGRSIAVPTHAL